MNKQNFKNGNAMFPISTDALDFMQEQTLLVAQLTALAGSRVIVRKPTNGKDGLCIFDGELLPLTGTATGTHIQIAETTTDITARGTTYKDARVVRQAVYTNGDGESVETFVVLDNMLTLKTSIANLNSALESEKSTRAQHDVPKGTIIDWYGTIVVSKMPDSFLPCGKIVVGSIDQVHTEQTLWRDKMHGGLEFEEGYNGNGYYYRIKSWNGYTIPDLTDRFIVQAGGDYALGATGGAKEVKLTAGQSGLPEHNHEVPVGDSTGSTAGGAEKGNNTEYSKFRTVNAGPQDATYSHENRPPFFALYKLIKVI